MSRSGVRLCGDEVQRRAGGHGWLALDAGLVVGQELVEVGDGPGMQVGQAVRFAFLGVGDPPYENQGHVSAKLQRPSGFQRRLERDLSDAFGTTLYDLPETREEVLTASKISGPVSVCTRL